VVQRNECGEVLFATIDECPGYRFFADGGVASCWKAGRYPCMTEEWWWMAPNRKPHGFREFRLRISGQMTRVYVHDMLCWAIHGARPTGTECLFRDGNRDNIRDTNVFWGIAPENIMSPDVEFREIPECEGYRFGSDGSIFSCWGSGRDEPTDTWKRISIDPNVRSGHLQCRVKINGKTTSVGVHHMICWAFHGPCPEGLECCHNDGIPDHNWPGNLRWDTRRSNINDQIRHGVHGWLTRDIAEVA
jgi:HNH endonuclease